MKIKDITESLYDTITGITQAYGRSKASRIATMSGGVSSVMTALVHEIQRGTDEEIAVRTIQQKLMRRGISQKDAEELVDAAKSKYDSEIKYRKSKAAPTQAQPAKPAQQPVQQPAPDTLDNIPQGKRIVLRVPPTPGQTMSPVYYKTNAGWTNETGQKVTNPKSIDYLDQLADRIGKIETV